jgi:predicted GNAT family N-acyltransferase
VSDGQPLVIEPLNDDHHRPAFQCGIESLDSYLKRQAKQDIKRRISRVFVATTPADPNHIVGYYTLSSLSIELDQLPEALARKLPKHPIPAALIGRLAVSKNGRGNGVGTMLLVDAIKRTLAVSEEIAIYAMVVEAINEEASAFYRQFGFSPFSQGGNRFFLPLKSIRPSTTTTQPMFR